VSNDGIGVNKSGINNNANIIDAGDNGSINGQSINESRVNNANVNTVSTNIDNNNDGVEKPSGTQSKTGMNGIGAKRAMFEEDIKKEPILQTILDVFDGKLLS
jgi:hypothetical protein